MLWGCKKCGRVWRHKVDSCIFCEKPLEEVTLGLLKVAGLTEVLTPSAEHRDIPYYELLLADERGNLLVRKSLIKHEIGESLKSPDLEVNPLHVGIVGTGIMGTQLVQLFLQRGHTVILCGRSQEKLVDARKKIASRLTKGMSPEEVEGMLKKLDASIELLSLKDCDLIIEAVSEDECLKKEVCARISKHAKGDAIIATNTSSISISELSTEVKDPRRFVGMHFFNPVNRMNLVEVVYGKDTSKETVEYIVRISKSLGKTPICVKDSPGFIVNRILMPMINEAAMLVEEGADAKDVDCAVTLGLNHPMGPLELADLIGLDTCISIMNTLKARFGDEKYTPCKALTSLVEKGFLGKKTGRGFYEYKV